MEGRNGSEGRGGGDDRERKKNCVGDGVEREKSWDGERDGREEGRHKRNGRGEKGNGKTTAQKKKKKLIWGSRTKEILKKIKGKGTDTTGRKHLSNFIRHILVQAMTHATK